MTLNRLSLWLPLALASVNCLTNSLLSQEPVAWPAFLGAGSSPLKPDSLPTKWSKTDRVLWKTPLVGHGQSSPVVWGDSVFVTTVDGSMKDEFVLYSLSAKNGQTNWMQKCKNSAPVANSVYVSRAATTPVVDAQRVIAYYESGDCVAYTHAGEKIWQRSLHKDLGPFVAEFGLSASPCQNEKMAFVLLEHDGPSYLVALNKDSGEIVWKTSRTSRRSWASPALFKIDGTEQIVISSAGSVDGYDASTGKPLWTVEGIGGNTGVTPIDTGTGTFLIGASGGRQGENDAAAKKSNGLVQVKKEGDVWTAKVVWSNEKLSPSWGSPIEHQGLAYWVNRVGVVTCVDAKTGEQLFSERTKQSCWATPIAAGDRIYFFGKDGLTTVIKSGRKFEIVAENELVDPESLPPETTKIDQETTEERRRASAMFSGPTLYAVVPAGDRWIGRIGNQVYCIQ